MIAAGPHRGSGRGAWHIAFEQFSDARPKIEASHDELNRGTPGGDGLRASTSVEMFWTEGAFWDRRKA
jgi:hypothetical protein